MTAFLEEYSKIYDCLYHDKPYATEVEFILNETKKMSHEQISVLDYGCGTGRHSIEFFKRGLKVIGFDVSSDMLALAAKNYPSIVFSNEIPQEQFSLVCCLFAVFNYLPGKTAAIEVLKTMKKSLTPGGVIVIEMWNGVSVPFLSERSKTKEINTPLGKVLRKTTTELDWMAQILTVNFECELEGKLLAKETHPMHYYTPQEFREMASLANLELCHKTVAYEDKVPTPQDYNLIYYLK
jgi:SAM-dependent methyltransferase